MSAFGGDTSVSVGDEERTEATEIEAVSGTVADVSVQLPSVQLELVLTLPRVMPEKMG